MSFLQVSKRAEGAFQHARTTPFQNCTGRRTPNRNQKKYQAIQSVYVERSASRHVGLGSGVWTVVFTNNRATGAGMELW